VKLIIYLCVLGRINVILGMYFFGCVCVCFFLLQWIINAIKERHFFIKKNFGFLGRIDLINFRVFNYLFVF
jgi:hypothetical protein